MKQLIYFFIFTLYSGFVQSYEEIPQQCPRIYFELNTCIECLEKDPIDEILVIGNSITKHGQYAEIGWPYNWGMAASAEENDWVHLVTEYLSKDQNIDVKLNILNNVDVLWIDREWDRIKQHVISNKNKIIFIQIGDNAIDTHFNSFERPYRKLLDFIQEKSSAKVFLLSTWRISSNFPNGNADSIIKNLADEYSHSFISINQLYKDPLNQAKDEALCQNPDINHHVCWHPGDIGMKAIAFEVCNQGHSSKYNKEKMELTLEDILSGNKHFTAKLKDEGNNVFSLLEVDFIKTNHYDSHSTFYDAEKGLAAIPFMYKNHKYYNVKLQQYFEDNKMLFKLTVVK